MARRRQTTAATASRRVGLLLVMASLLLVALPASGARAGELQFSDLGPFEFWSYTADPGLSQTITIAAVGTTRFTLQDSADSITVDTGGRCVLDPLCGCVFLATTPANRKIECTRNRSLTVHAGDGTDTVTAGGVDLGTTTLGLFGDEGVDQLTGGQGSDTLDAGSGNDIRVFGGDGNDTLRGGIGADSGINGEGGTDTLSYNDGRTTGVTASFTSGSGSDGDIFTAIDALDGSANNDTLTGTASGNTISGGSGNDTLVGGGGADTLNGGAGIDTVSYDDTRATAVTATIGGNNGDNDDYLGIENLIGGPSNDSLTGDAGANVLNGGAGDDVLRGGPGADTLIGGGGSNFASYDERTASVAASLAPGGSHPDGDSFTQVQNLRGGDADDTLTGDAGENRLEGGPGDDTLIGGGEDDDLLGGGGRNTASYEERGTGVVASLEPSGAKPDSDTFADIQSLRAGSGDDALTGDDAANTLDGGAGADTITGLAGIDDLRGADGDDTVKAADGIPDQIDCGNGTDGADVDTVDAFNACEIVTGLPVIVFAAPPADNDRDGFNATLDCNDANAAIRPGAIEILGNTVDENCDKIASDFPLIGSAISIFVDARRTSTKLTEVTITGIVAGGSVEARCKPPKGKRKACPFTLKKQSFPNGRRKLLITSWFKGRSLLVGTVIDLRVLGPNAYGKVRIETIGKRKTTRRVQCLRPGATKPAACPLS